MVAATLFAPAASQAAAPCWQRVLDDWRDGRIDGAYSVHCYRDALSHLPEDLRVYGTAEADIQRALTRELAEHSAQAHRRTPAVATPRRPEATSKDAPRPERRTLAMHSSKPTKAKQSKARRTAARPTAAAQRNNSFPVTLLLVIGGAAVVAAVALASWRRVAPVRRRRQDV
jgi:hypothetical protein